MSITLLQGDCREVLATLPAASIDACVTDPPYGLEFMNKGWDAPWRQAQSRGLPGARDGVALPTWKSDRNPKCLVCRKQKRGAKKCRCACPQWDETQVQTMTRQMRHFQDWTQDWASEVYRVLKPGAHLAAFGGTRTFHRVAVAIEDAGFEIRDTLCWLYGCLDEQTEVATADGVKPYHKTKAGDLVLCYDPSSGEYSYQPILDVVEYDYADTAYRLIGDFGEQVVSRNHRVIVERDGVEAFVLAEEAAREREARVPILESLPELQQALSSANQGASGQKQGVLSELCGGAYRNGEQGVDTARDAQGQGYGDVLELRHDLLAQREVARAGRDPDVLQPVQRRSARGGVGRTCPQGPGLLGAGVGSRTPEQDDWIDQPSVEGRSYLSEPQGQVRRAIDQICPVSCGPSDDGQERRVRDGAQVDCRESDWSTAGPNRSGSSSEPPSDGQRDCEPDAVRHERGAQGLRAWRGHRTAVVRIVPFQHVGKVWCLRVPTGAFVAVRRGVAFPTGNSGFPKSHNQPGGWGTALKPAWEPIILARKPLVGTVAGNMAAHGTGALNIEKCRVSPSSQPLDEDVCGLLFALGSPRDNGADFPERPPYFAQRICAALGACSNGRTAHEHNAAGRDGHTTEEDVRAVQSLLSRLRSSVELYAGSWSEALSSLLGCQTCRRFGDEHSRLIKEAARDGLPSLAGALADTCRWLYARTYNRGCPCSGHPSSSGVEDLRESLLFDLISLAKQQDATYLTPRKDITRNHSRGSSSASSKGIYGDSRAQETHQTEGQSLGRWPANVAHDGSDEVLEAFARFGSRRSAGDYPSDSQGTGNGVTYCHKKPQGQLYADTGTAARFFYTAKSSREERGEGNNHPTVKPLALMRWLCRLITPPGGTVLDPFLGSGSTAIAADQEGFHCIGIEQSAEYLDIARRRLATEAPLFTEVA